MSQIKNSFTQQVLLLPCFAFLSSVDSSVNAESIVPSYGVQSADNQDVPDRTEKEPIYMSIFKLIVNCNPFKEKKAQQ